MRHLAILLACAVPLAGCGNSTGQPVTSTLQARFVSVLATPPGQLFCKAYTGGGEPVIVAVVTSASQAIPAPGNTLAVLAENAAAATVADDCTAAAMALGATSATPTPPPAAAQVQAVPIATPPAGTVTAPETAPLTATAPPS